MGETCLLFNYCPFNSIQRTREVLYPGRPCLPGVPVKTDKPEQGEFGMIDPIVMYDNMMNKFKWGNAGAPHVYLDENNKRMFSNFRRIFGTLGKLYLSAEIH